MVVVFATFPYTLAVAQPVALPTEATPPPPGTSTQFNAGLQLQYTDNANLTPVNEQSDVIYQPFFGVNYSRQTSRTDAKIAFQVNSYNYKNETQQNQTSPSLDAQIKWFLVPESFTWTLNDFASQNRINVQSAPTNANTQNTNAFITGPDGFLHFGPSNRLQLGARYADTYFQNTNEDSTRVTGYTRWLYSSSPRTVLSANYEASSVRFDDPANPDFDRQDLFFGANTSGARSNLAFDLGVTVINQTGLSDNPEPLFRFSGNRQLTPKSNVGFAMAQVQADSGSNLFTTGAAPPGLAPGGSVANTPDIFTDTSLNLFYTHTGRRTTATISVFGRSQDYKTTPNDQSGWGTVFGLNRTLGPKWTTSLYATYSNTYYRQNIPPLTNKDTTAGLNFSYHLGRWLALNTGITWQNRNSTDPTQEYTETRVIFAITYTRGSTSGPATRPGAGTPAGPAANPGAGQPYPPR